MNETSKSKKEKGGEERGVSKFWHWYFEKSFKCKEV